MGPVNVFSFIQLSNFRTQIAEEIAILKKEKILIEIKNGVCYYPIFDSQSP